MVFVPTLFTCATIGSNDMVRSLYWIKFPTFIFPGNNSFELVIVLTPLETADIVAIPIFSDTDWITSALKVLIPTVPSVVPYNDFTSEILLSVISVIILPFSIPSKIKDSFLINLPDFW